MRSPPARRRSSLVPPPTAKPGTYRARTIAFAPNITPDSFDQPPSDVDDIEDGDNEFSLFPPSQEPAVPAKRRHKKRPADHVPRPPNAFMLFRADFVRQKHVPGSIETNHTSLSKIIGSLWRSLPPSEKRVWEHRAKQEKVQHQRKYPDYKYKPVHNRAKAKSVKKEERIENDEERCEEIAQLLLDGNKGAGLAEAVRRLDKKRRGSDSGVVASNSSAGGDTWMRRRSSSVPPELNQASLYLPRRPSSSSGAFPSSSSLPHSYYPPEYLPPYPSQHHHLPSVNTALFNPEYLQDSNPFSHSAPPPSFSNPFSYESTSPYDMPPSFSSADVSAAPSPAPSSEGSLPPLYAPQPQRSMDAVLPFLSASQRMSISEGRFSFSDLTAEQRSGLRQSFGWSENIDMTQLYTQPHQEQYTRVENGYTEFSYEGRRFSISEMDFAALMEHAGNPLHAHLVQGDGSSDSGDTLGGNHNRDLCIAPHDTVMGNDMAGDY